MPPGPAACIGDTHVCPAVNGPVPHVGGAITGPPLVPNVLIGGRPVAVVGTMTACVGPPGTVMMGSTTVFAQGMPVARLGDPAAHGGVISGPGCPTVIVGG